MYNIKMEKGFVDIHVDCENLKDSIEKLNKEKKTIKWKTKRKERERRSKGAWEGIRRGKKWHETKLNINVIVAKYK